MSDEAMDSIVDELLELNQRLLDCIAAADWETYCEICDSALTAFEPEARGQLVEGLEFHRFYFDLEQSDAPVNVTMVSPQVTLLGEDTAIVTCIRLVQHLADGSPKTARYEETRIWHRAGGAWRHVHFHRSEMG